VEQNLDFITAIASNILLIERGFISQQVSALEKSELEQLRKKLTV
jgi:cytochrome oxidase assembly protein ShyY1